MLKGAQRMHRSNNLLDLGALLIGFLRYWANLLTYLPCSPYTTKRYNSCHRVQLSFSEFRLDVKTLLYPI
jgi:hypothetical protein